jgi:hypothetical protein
MQYVIFSLVVLVLVGLLFIVRWTDNNAKNKYRRDAYKLLDSPAPDPAMIKKTMKGLHIYGGRWRRDKEFAQLIRRLSEKLDSING